MMVKDPKLIADQEWIGYDQPVGFVVSTPAFLAAQVYVIRNIIPEDQRFLECVEPIPGKKIEDAILAVTDFPHFLREVLDWHPPSLYPT